MADKRIASMRNGFTKIPNLILDLPWANNPIVVYLYTWLSLHADKNGEIRMSLNEISSSTGLSRMQVRRALEKLRATQVVTQVATQPATQVPSTLTVCFLSSSKPKKLSPDTALDLAFDTASDPPRAYKNDNNNIMSIEDDNKEEENNTNVLSENAPDVETRFKNWMKTNFPLVCEMKKPLEYNQYSGILVRGYTVDEVTNVLMDMENWSKLKTKTSAYLTLLKWLKKDYGERNFTTT